MNDDIQALFDAIDAFDVDRFLRFLAPDASFTLGNFPAAHGHAEIRQAFSGFAATLTSLNHEIVEIWQTPDACIVEQRVSYGDAWQRCHVLPCTNVMRQKDGVITDYRVFVDISPLFVAPPEPGSA